MLKVRVNKNILQLANFELIKVWDNDDIRIFPAKIRQEQDRQLFGCPDTIKLRERINLRRLKQYQIDTLDENSVDLGRSPPYGLCIKLVSLGLTLCKVFCCIL